MPIYRGGLGSGIFATHLFHQGTRHGYTGGTRDFGGYGNGLEARRIEQPQGIAASRSTTPKLFAVVEVSVRLAVGGSVARVVTLAEGSGQKSASGGSEAALVTRAGGLGQKSAQGGSVAGVGVTALAEGRDRMWRWLPVEVSPGVWDLKLVPVDEWVPVGVPAAVWRLLGIDPTEWRVKESAKTDYR